MRHHKGKFHWESGGEVVGGEVGHDEIILLQLAQVLCEIFGLAPHAHQSVRLPIRIGELGDHVALDRFLLAHLFDLVFQRQVFVFLRRPSERTVTGIDAVEAIPMQAVEDSGGAGKFAPVEVSREPPGQLVGRR